MAVHDQELRVQGLDAAAVGDLVGRSVFGLGAVTIWIVVIALTVSTVRKLLNRG